MTVFAGAIKIRKVNLKLQGMQKNMSRVIIFVLFTALQAGATSYVVTNAADGGPGSLRTLMASANSGDVITFAPSFSEQTITLTNDIDPAGDLTITATNLPGGLTIEGNSVDRLFTISNGDSLTLSGLQLTGGGGNSKPGSAEGGYGGAIYCNGNLVMTQCVICSNAASDAGAVFIDAAANVSLTRCTISGNGIRDGSGGGAFDGAGTMTFSQCLICSNYVTTSEASAGIGLNEGYAYFYDCTLVSNSGGFAGWWNGSNLTLVNCTFTGNSASYCGGVFNNEFNWAGLDRTINIVAMTNTILSGNSPSDYSNIGSAGLPGILNGSSNLMSVGSLELAPLGNYGGPTLTMPPLPGSPAIDAGDDTAASGLTTDQRGYPRLSGPHADIGAVEVQYAPANTGTPVLTGSSLSSSGQTFQFTFTNAPDLDFSVLASTNVSSALTSWTVLGYAWPVSPGQYEFTDASISNFIGRYYNVVALQW